MKSANEWKLSPVDLDRAVDGLKQFIEEVVNNSAPYKTQAIFIKGYSDGALIEIEGEQFFINQRFCYFTPGLPSKGDLVYVDNRYIH